MCAQVYMYLALGGWVSIVAPLHLAVALEPRGGHLQSINPLGHATMRSLGRLVQERIVAGAQQMRGFLSVYWAGRVH